MCISEEIIYCATSPSDENSRRQCLNIRNLSNLYFLPISLLNYLGDVQFIKDHREDSSYYEYQPTLKLKEPGVKALILLKNMF